MDAGETIFVKGLIAGLTAIVAAFFLGYVAHFEFGLSRTQIREAALAAAVIVAILTIVELFGKKLQKS